MLSSTFSNKGIALGFVPLIIIGLLFGIYLAAAVSSTTTLVNFSGFTKNAQSTNSTFNLQLVVSINSTYINSGQGILINITEYNTLQAVNNASAANNWSIGILSLGPCGHMIYPFGAEVFVGYYTSSNISSATPLNLFAPGIYNCPAIFSVDYYLFQPESDYASVYVASTNNTSVQCCSAQPFPITGTLNVGNYWDNSNVEHNLGLGVYTVAAGDGWGWGQLVLLHFAIVP